MFLYKKIEVSKVKGKKLKALFDKLVSKAIKAEDFNATRILNEQLYTKKAKLEAMDLIKHYKETKRHSGFTRMIATSFRRGDNAEMSLIEIVE